MKMNTKQIAEKIEREIDCGCTSCYPVTCERCGQKEESLHENKYCDLCFKKVGDAQEAAADFRQTIKDYHKLKGQ